MRLLHRNETDPHDERVHDPDTARTPDEPRERSSWRSMFQRTDDPDNDARDDRDRDRARAGPCRTAERDRDDARARRGRARP